MATPYSKDMYPALEQLHGYKFKCGHFAVALPRGAVCEDGTIDKLAKSMHYDSDNSGTFEVAIGIVSQDKKLMTNVVRVCGTFENESGDPRTNKYNIVVADYVGTTVVIGDDGFLSHVWRNDDRDTFLTYKGKKASDLNAMYRSIIVERIDHDVEQLLRPENSNLVELYLWEKWLELERDRRDAEEASEEYYEFDDDDECVEQDEAINS